MRPLVSILIPAYNAEPWISDALRSAIAQTWEPKKIIVVDNASTDRTLEIARQLESDQLRVVASEHQGAAATRNKAFSLSKGDYIKYLDADEKWSLSGSRWNCTSAISVRLTIVLGGKKPA